MQKLIAAYLAHSTGATARKIRNYALKHPMSLVLLTTEEQSIVNEAMELIGSSTLALSCEALRAS